MERLKYGGAIQEQRVEFDHWISSRPHEPDHPKPTKAQVFASLGNCVGLMCAGASAGALVMVIGVALWNKSGTGAFLLLLTVAVLVGVTLPICFAAIIDKIYDKRFGREMQSSGWAAYTNELDAWRADGNARLSALALQNPSIATRLSSQINPK
jgi:hypothetical protein